MRLTSFTSTLVLIVICSACNSSIIIISIITIFASNIVSYSENNTNSTITVDLSMSLQKFTFFVTEHQTPLDTVYGPPQVERGQDSVLLLPRDGTGGLETES